MPRNQLLKGSKQTKNEALHGQDAEEESHTLRKAEIKESLFRPAATRASQGNRLRDVLELQKAQFQQELQRGYGHRLKSLVFYVFSPMQGENFTPKNPWIIHPTSIASSTMLITSGILLIYSAIQVPLDIGFYWNFEVCETDPILIRFNVFVDTFFVFEICFNFFVGVWHKGEYVETMGTIAWVYVKGRFLFDAITSIPTSWFELAALGSCGTEAGPVTSNAVSDAMKFLRLLKPLRLTKLLRIIKFAKIFDVLDRMLRISPQILQIAKLIFGVALLVHFLSCIFWLLKESYDPNFKEFMANFEVTEGVSKKWLLAMYFVNTVFTTVGFGDISGTNDVERAFCIVVMWVGTAVFAVIINKLQRAAAEMNERNREKNQEIQKVVRFMREHKAPAWMEQEVRTWLNFHIDRMTAKRERHQVLATLPPKLRNQVVLQINSKAFSSAWVFGRLMHEDNTKFITELVLQTGNHIIAKGQLIASDKSDCALPSLPPAPHSQDVEEKVEDHTEHHSELVVDGSRQAQGNTTGLFEDPELPSRPEDNQLYIVEVGAVVVTVWFKGTSTMIESKTLTKGHFFGERRLLLDAGCTGGWGFNEDMEFEFRAVENTELITLTKKTFDKVVGRFPPETLNEIKLEAGRLWGAADPHIEDLRLQIELDLVGRDSEFSKSRRARLHWERLSIHLVAQKTSDFAMRNVLFNLSLPSKTADPMAAMRARPDWSAGSLRNSRMDMHGWRPNTRYPSRTGSVRAGTRASSMRSNTTTRTPSGPGQMIAEDLLAASLAGATGAPGLDRADAFSTIPESPSAPTRATTSETEVEGMQMELVDDRIDMRRRSLFSTFTGMLTRPRRSSTEASGQAQPDSVVSANLVIVDTSSVEGSRPCSPPPMRPSASSTKSRRVAGQRMTSSLHFGDEGDGAGP